MPSNHLILCRPLLLLPSIFPSFRVFSNASALRMRWPKCWSFSLNISPSNEHPGLISFRMDWLDLLAVQGTLKSLLQHHSSKASILRRSAFFTVQLSEICIIILLFLLYTWGTWNREQLNNLPKVTNPKVVERDAVERKETWVYPWVGKIPWRKAWQPTPVFLPGESHGQRSLVSQSCTQLKWLSMVEICIQTQTVRLQFCSCQLLLKRGGYWRYSVILPSPSK